jgi:hypothetical protein
LRDGFNKKLIPYFNTRSDHTHGFSASARAAASVFWVNYAQSMHREPYFVQMAKRDVDAGCRGSRTYFDPKDVDTPVESWDPPSNPLFILVDTDYFMNMPVELATTFAGHPVALYTMVPARAGNGEGEVTWCFDGDGTIEVSVSGAAKFAHGLWDYGNDILMTATSARVASYCVDRKNVTPLHQLVLLSPLGVYRFPTSLLAAWLLPGKYLERLNPCVGDVDKFVRLAIHTVEGRQVSTARVGSFLSSLTTSSVDSALRSVAKNSGVTLTLGTVQSHMKLKPTPEEFCQLRQEATVLLDYFLNCEHIEPRAVVYPVHRAVRSFEAGYVDSPPDDGGKRAMVAFMQPLCHEGFAPLVSKNNERRAIEGRVLENRSKVELTTFDQQLLTEFVNFVVPPHIRGTLHPVDETDVVKRQNAPRQRRALRFAAWLINPFRRVYEMFLKKEAYGKTTDPRVIIQVDPVAKMTISKYMYAMQPVLKNCVWYAPGKTPKEIAARVADICQEADFISDDDANRMDGHISPAAREVDKQVDLAAFAPVHHGEVYSYHRESRGLPVTTTFGLKYQSEDEWGSGDPRTSNSQTLRNGFIHYGGFRRMGKKPQDAWDSLGLYAGDDGFTADLPAEHIIAAAAAIGQVYEVNTVLRGQEGVQFLGRYYGPNVFSGDDNSVCDIRRALSKLHLSIPGQYTPAEKASQKAFALMLTDRNTPVLGQWAKRVSAAFPLTRDLDPRDVSWWAYKYGASEQWPNLVGTWALNLLQRQIPDFDFARFNHWIQTCEDGALFEAPVFAVPSEQDRPGIVEIGDPRGNVVGLLEPNPLVREQGERLPAKEKEEEIMTEVTGSTAEEASVSEKAKVPKKPKPSDGPPSCKHCKRTWKELKMYGTEGAAMKRKLHNVKCDAREESSERP